MKQLMCVFAVVASAGCLRAPPERIPGELDAQPRTLTFPKAFVSYPQTSSVTLTNHRATSIDVTLALPAPFSADREVVHLGAGEATTVAVRFAPSAPGPARGALTASAGSDQVTVALVGEAATPPDCSSPDVCHTAAFDPNVGACVSSAAAEGTPCGVPNACSHGSCVAGACVDVPRDCDDQDPCTTDSCDPDRGCLHTPLTTYCAASPCEGPDGGALPLRLLWSYSPPAGYQLWTFPGIADPDGNIYWLEVTNAPDVVVVSATPDGQIRFRTQPRVLGNPNDWHTAPFMLFADGALVVKLSRSPQAGSTDAPFVGPVAISPVDGSVLWATNLLQQPGLDASYAWSLRQSGYDGHDTLLLDASGYQGCENRSWMLAVDLRTGATTGNPFEYSGSSDCMVLSQPTKAFVGFSGTVCDANGAFNTYSSAVALDGGMWKIAQDESPLAAYGDALVEGTVRSWNEVHLRSTRDGHELGAVTGMILASDPPFEDPGTSVTLTRDRGWFVTDGSPQRLVAFDPSNAAVLWSAPLPGGVIQPPILTNRGSMVVLGILYMNPTAQSLRLDEVLPDGRAGFTCWIGGPGSLQMDDWLPSRAILQGGRYVLGGRQAQLAAHGASIAAFELGGYDVAASGWVAPGANLQRNGFAH